MATTMVADASFLLNLGATGRSVEILRKLDLELLVSDRVAEEKLLLGEREANGRLRLRPIALDELSAAGLLTRRALDQQAVDTLVRCATHLDDADALTVTLAVSAGLPLATDDGRQRRVARELFPSLPLTSTSELLLRAGEGLELDAAAMRRLATDVHHRANFMPTLDDPQRAWFLGCLGAPEAGAGDQSGC